MKRNDQTSNHNILRFGRTPHNIMRFGRAGHNILHFGKRVPIPAETEEIPVPVYYEREIPMSSDTSSVLDVVDPSSLLYVKKSPQSFASRFFIPHLFLSSFYASRSPSPSRPNSSFHSSQPSSVIAPSSSSFSSSHSTSHSYPSFLTLSRLNSYTGSFNKKASDPRGDRDNVFMHFG